MLIYLSEVANIICLLSYDHSKALIDNKVVINYSLKIIVFLKSINLIKESLQSSKANYLLLLIDDLFIPLFIDFIVFIGVCL